MRYSHLIVLALTLVLAACSHPAQQAPDAYLRVSGEYVLTAEGDTFLIRGTNLGNWLNPEGYMFGLRRTNSVGMIDRAFSELIGPDATAAFWQQWKESYITESDIRFIASTGANTIRLPFHYKLFTPDLYLGSYSDEDGFSRIDSVVAWSKRHGLHVILDMHDAPGGQTGDNIDDSFGYPWLFVSEPSQQLFCSIWQRIAQYYRDEPTILGYELINEPIAHYFQPDLDSLNARLEPLYKRAVAAIREVDTCHIILLGGAQWNGTFEGVLRDTHFDSRLLFTCHRYHQPCTLKGIADIVRWRDSTHVAMYMGETGHNTIPWTEASCLLYDSLHIGYTFWPYKKMGRSSWVGFAAPEGWQHIVRFAESDRSTYDAIRSARYACLDSLHGQQPADLIFALLDSCRLPHCTIDTAYIAAMHLHDK